MKMELRYCITLAGLIATFGGSAAACGDDDNGTESGSTTSGSWTTSGSGTGGGGTGTGTGGGGAGGGDGGGGGTPSSSLISDDFESYAAQGEPGGKWKIYTAMDGSAVTVDTA